jgi:hypothetical protein
LRVIKERPLAEGDMRIEKSDQGHGRIVRIGRAMAKEAKDNAVAPRKRIADDPGSCEARQVSHMANTLAPMGPGAPHSRAF